jgi:hypothetical protein
MKGYLGLLEVFQFMDNLATLYPDYVEYFTLAQSSEIRDIRGIKLTNKQVQGPKGASVFSAGQVSGYPISTSAALYLAENLLKQSSFAYVNYLLSTREVFVFPVVNPDAYAWTERNFLRHGEFLQFFTNKNFTGCSGLAENGVRLNRNWGYMWNVTGVSSDNPCSDSFPGSQPFSEVETRSIQEYFGDGLVQTWLHYDWDGDKYVLPYSFTTKQSYSKMQSYLFEKVQSKMDTMWQVGSSKDLLGTLEDGSLIDYYFNKGTLSLQGSLGNQTMNATESLIVLESHYEVALELVELSGVYLVNAGSNSQYIDCYPNCKNKDINYEALFEFTVNNTGLSSTSAGYLHISMISGLILETFLKIHSVSVNFTRLFNENDTTSQVYQDSLHRSDSVYFIENLVIPPLTSARFFVEVWANSTSVSHEKTNMLCEFTLTFPNGYDYGFSENEILKVADHDDEGDGDGDDKKSVVVGVVVSLVVLVVLVAVGIVAFKFWKKRKENLEKPDFNTTMQAEGKI